MSKLQLVDMGNTTTNQWCIVIWSLKSQDAASGSRRTSCLMSMKINWKSFCSSRRDASQSLHNSIWIYWQSLIFLVPFSKKLAAEHGLNWPVVQRLENLKSILEWAQSNAIKDKYNIASNIQNVILAYQSGVLNWCHGFVTYWHKGAQLCAPRPFKWNEFQYLYDAHKGNETGFWVEGVSPVRCPDIRRYKSMLIWII